MTLLFFVLLTGLSINTASNLSLDSSLVNLLPESYTSVKTLKEIQRKVGGFESLNVLIEGDKFPKLVSAAKVLTRDIEKLPNVKFANFSKDVDFFYEHALLYLKQEDLIDIRNQLESKINDNINKKNPFFVSVSDEKKSNNFTLQQYREEYKITDQKKYYIPPDKSLIVIKIYPEGNYTNIGFAKKFYHQIKRTISKTVKHKDLSNLKISYGGSFKNKIDEFNTIIKDVKYSTILGLFLVILLIFFYFQKFIPVAIVSIALFAGLSWTFALTYILIGDLNTLTVFLFIVLFGLGIDYGIHFMARYIEERSLHRAPLDAIKKTLKNTGKALYISALTSALAFSTLLISDFKGFYEYGIISTIGILFSFLAIIIICPLFILLAEKYLPRKVFIANNSQTTFSKFNPVLFFFSQKKYIISFLLCLIFIGGVFSASSIPFQYDFSELRANLSESIIVKEKLKKVFTESNSPAVVMLNSKNDIDLMQNYIERKRKNDPTPTIDKFKTIYSFIPKKQDQKIKIIEEIKSQMRRVKNKKLNEQELKDLNELKRLTKVNQISIRDLPKSIRNLFNSKEADINKFGYIYSNVQLRNALNAKAFADDVLNIEIDNKTFHAANSSIVFSELLTMVIKDGKIIVMLAATLIILSVLLIMRSFKNSLLALIPLSIGLCLTFIIMTLTGLKINFFNMITIPIIIGIGVDNGIHLTHRYIESKGDLTPIINHTIPTVFTSSITTMVGFIG